MNAVCVYVSTAQLVLQTESVAVQSEQQLHDLNRLLSHLRQLLSCVVCCRLLNDPYGPRNKRCQHNVCRVCIHGQKSLRPLCIHCRDCQDYKTYDENRQMRCLMVCYKSLCEFLTGAPMFDQLSKLKLSNIVNSISCSLPLPNMSPQELVLEGANYDDILNAFNADLPHAIIPNLHFPVSSSHTLINSSSVSASASATSPMAPASTVHIHGVSQSIVNTTTPPISSSTHFVKPRMHINPNSTTSPPLLPTTTVQTQTLTLKHLKSIMDLSPTVKLPILSNLSTKSVTASTTESKMSNVVVTVGSSPVSKTPLSIASSKLQGLNRQLGSTRNAFIVSSNASKTSTSSETHPPLTLKVSLSGASFRTIQPKANSSASTTPTTATITSQQILNPPPIKTVSNGSAMYSVLYTGIGNKITIKRKIDGDEDSTQRKNTSASSSSSTVFGQNTKTSSKKRGCRCGNATPTPGKLTCCGQRCPCYVDSKSCIGCKCRGCRNPHRPDGNKVRPVIPELACYEIQMADDNSRLSPSELPIATTRSTSTLPTSTIVSYGENSQTESPNQLDEFTFNNATRGHQMNMTSSGAGVSSTTSTTTGALIPILSLQQNTPQMQQQVQNLNPLNGGLSRNEVVQPSSMLQLENLQSKSVLIQNSEGKYQVVNVLTTGSTVQSTNQMPGIQCLQTISQLQSGGQSSSSSISSIANTPFTTSFSPTLTQLFTTQDQQQQQQQVVNSSNGQTSIVTSHVQQHFNSNNNNFITLHSLSSPHTTTSSLTQAMPLNSSTSSQSITLSPIIVTSPDSFTPDIFSDSSDEFPSLSNALSVSSSTNASRCVSIAAAAAGHNSSSPLSIGSGGGRSNTPNVHSTTQLAPIAELIDSNDLLNLEPNWFACL
ncbi:E3 ubiquitin-protein ligase MSL2 [Teleopsis dalmanni]|uniref:E3 ubiquitin-protein ligase MSL2 n=1 Tax=Teleopsis dalmanni TaxID=139649 RepID=UPI0018CDEE49|nr:E3 ubiquitin-protein ligase MSL2 [Teleopsis dalmanni]